MKIVECVPNISEGRDRRLIDRVAAEVEAVSGATLLDVDPGADTNRTVITFAGEPDGVAEAAFRLAARAVELIDMARHRGAHPRNGALDVLPFVPVSGVTMQECVALARAVGRRIGDELRVPVFLYEQAASRPERRNLSDVRKGEYEALAFKLRDPAWAPDFGPAEFDARTGATQIGARQFLIAYNIDLNTRDVRLARSIAAEIRESGKPVRDAAGKPVVGPDGAAERAPGLFEHCKAGGWYLSEHGFCQVTVNLTDFHVTSMHAVFDKVSEIADGMGLRATGSEIVGLVPLEAMLESGRHYLRRQGRTSGVPEEVLVASAARSLGLSDFTSFAAEKKIVEYRLGRGPGLLARRTLSSFVDEVSLDSAVPGGGSVAALCGALAAALVSMVASLSHAKASLAGARPGMAETGERAQALKARLLALVDEDASAFDAVMAANRRPSATAAEQAEKATALDAANRRATESPLAVMEAASEVVVLSRAVAEHGLRASISDAGVAAHAARAASEGAFMNVLINLPGLTDREYAASARARAERLRASVAAESDSVADMVLGRL